MHRSALLGQSLTWRPPRPAAFLPMQCLFGAAAAAAGWGRLQQQRPHQQVIPSKRTKVYKSSSALPLLLPKNYTDAAIAAPLVINT